MAVTAGQVRMRWIGHSLHAELAVAVDTNLTVDEAHHIAHAVEHQLAHTAPRLVKAVEHTEPATGAETAHRTLAHQWWPPAAPFGAEAPSS